MMNLGTHPKFVGYTLRNIHANFGVLIVQYFAIILLSVKPQDYNIMTYGQFYMNLNNPRPLPD